MDLTAYIRQRRNEKGLALMTHIVLGYPSFDVSYDLVGAMVAAGVDLMELQIPFSEPIADGPVILRPIRRRWPREPRWTDVWPSRAGWRPISRFLLFL